MNDDRNAAINLPLVSAIVGVATIGGFMFGYDSGVINGTQEGLRTTFHLSEAWLGITVSALLPGCAVGAPPELGGVGTAGFRRHQPRAASSVIPRVLSP